MTFDDGPIPEVTSWVLNLLRQSTIKATFFCVGENVAKNPEVFNQIIEDGHSIGNHTFNHLNGWNTDTNKYIQNIKLCDELVHSNLFRPPYGKLKPTQSLLLNPKYKVIMWDVLSGDYDKETPPEKCLKNVNDNVRNGSVILFHDSLKAQLNMQYALPLFISYAKEKGFQFARLE